MEKKYFIVRNNQKYGPFTQEELGQVGITRDTLVWHEGLPDWMEAQYIEALQSFFYQRVQPPVQSTFIQEERIGNMVYHADKQHVTLYTPQGEIYYVYADFGDRLVGLLIDMLICMCLFILPLIGSWLYYAVLHSSEKQATVGQRAMGINCLSDEGNPIDFGQASGRFFMSIISGMICGIGYFLFFGSEKKQTLHDSVAKTIVVKEIGRKAYKF